MSSTSCAQDLKDRMGPRHRVCLGGKERSVGANTFDCVRGVAEQTRRPGDRIVFRTPRQWRRPVSYIRKSAERHTTHDSILEAFAGSFAGEEDIGGSIQAPGKTQNREFELEVQGVQGDLEALRFGEAQNSSWRQGTRWGRIEERRMAKFTDVHEFTGPPKIFQDFPPSPPATSPPMSDVAVFIPPDIEQDLRSHLLTPLPKSSHHLQPNPRKSGDKQLPNTPQYTAGAVHKVDISIQGLLQRKVNIFLKY
ncbi:hypothetical protein B0H14DRAFT_2581578 [Mycena olivaceomarginata]|nr:hypothetical protein B0H14DRAFT_2581578 [Mycena olivaceomarginata]